MEAIKWDDEFSVGVAEMDEQHQKLIAMINRLIAEQKTLTDPETIADLLTQMMDYAEVHFRAEEYLMSEYGYDRKDEQAEMHQEFIKQTQSFCSADNVGANVLSVALLQFLKNWLVKHILTEDMKYKPFFQTKEVS